MSWKIEIKPTAEKQYLKLDNTARGRIKRALRELEQEENPLFHKNVIPLTGQLKGDYRLRVGDWRILFMPDKDKRIIYVYAILPRVMRVKTQNKVAPGFSLRFIFNESNAA